MLIAKVKRVTKTRDAVMGQNKHDSSEILVNTSKETIGETIHAIFHIHKPCGFRG